MTFFTIDLRSFSMLSRDVRMGISKLNDATALEERDRFITCAYKNETIDHSLLRDIDSAN